MLTEWRGVIFGENLVLGSVRVEEQEVIEIADAVGQRANGKVFGRVGHEVPNHPLTCRDTASVTIRDVHLTRARLFSLTCAVRPAQRTGFVRILCHPGNSDSSDLRVAEA